MLMKKILEDGKLTFILNGRLDSTTTQFFEDNLVKGFQESPNVVLNCNALEYISSAGLRILLKIHKIIHPNNYQLTLTKVNAGVLDVLEMTGFIDMLTIEK